MIRLAHECLSIWDRSGHINHLFNMESCVRMVNILQSKDVSPSTILNLHWNRWSESEHTFLLRESRSFRRYAIISEINWRILADQKFCPWSLATSLSLVDGRFYIACCEGTSKRLVSWKGNAFPFAVLQSFITRLHGTSIRESSCSTNRSFVWVWFFCVYFERRKQSWLKLACKNCSIVLPSPLNDSSSCDSVFPLLNKLNIDKCRVIIFAVYRKMCT